MTTKADLLDLLDRSQATWEELAAEAQRTDVHRPGAIGQGNFIDVAGHLNGWRTRTVDRLEAAAQETDPPPPPWPESMDPATDEGLEQINRWFFERNHARTIAEVLAEATVQYRRMRAAVESIPEEDLLTPGRYPWLNGAPLSDVVTGSVEHLHEEHEAAIRSWLSSTDG